VIFGQIERQNSLFLIKQPIFFVFKNPEIRPPACCFRPPKTPKAALAAFDKI
jgi:hypothetical protein